MRDEPFRPSPHPTGYGLKIYMTRQMVAELKGQGDIEVKASVRVWRLGKDQTISRHSKLLYSLPAPEFDEHGEPVLEKVRNESSGQLLKEWPFATADEEVDLKYSDQPLPAPIRSDQMSVPPDRA